VSVPLFARRVNTIEKETVRNGVGRISVDDRKNLLRPVWYVTFLEHVLIFGDANSISDVVSVFERGFGRYCCLVISSSFSDVTSIGAAPIDR
jgi:hypothetical protein